MTLALESDPWQFDEAPLPLRGALRLALARRLGG